MHDVVPAALAPDVRNALRLRVVSDDAGRTTEEVVSRTRAMLGDAARQLLTARALSAEPGDIADLVAGLASDDAWLGHVHALALEGVMLERLRATRGADPVVSPRVQALMEEKSESAALAKRVIAAQARFVQYHRRMEIALRDVPSALLETAAKIVPTVMRLPRPDDHATREALLTQLAVLGESSEALDVAVAGFSLFASALSAASGVERDSVIARLAAGDLFTVEATLCAAGLSSRDTDAQLAWLYDAVPSASADPDDTAERSV